MIHLRGRKRKTRILLIIVSFLIVFSGYPSMLPFAETSGAYAAETPSAVYNGDPSAATVLGNLSYTDVVGNLWSKEAIYETGALGIVKNFGNTAKRFGRTTPVTKEEALAIAYRSTGQEAQAQQLGITLNNSRAAANKKTDPLAVLYDGFIQLAYNNGVITAQDYADAMNTDQTTLTAESFHRTASAQRQEMAYWLAGALGIQPSGQQKELLNYSDWRSTDPEKLGYMETVLQQGIMTGNGGRLNPKQAITREQAAQVVKNAETQVLNVLGDTKHSGTVESIVTTKDYTGTIAVTGKNIIVRGADGKTASILTSVPAATVSGAKNETAGTTQAAQKRELIVYKNGKIGNSILLAKGDRLQYITDANNVVKYANVVSNVNDVRYLAVQVNTVDRPNLQMSITELFKLDYPDVRSITGNISFSGGRNEKTSYRISATAEITVNGVKATLAGVTEDSTAILTITGNNIIKAIQCVDFGINSESRNIVRGIVEENNPELGYLTLYNEDGSGTGSSKAASLRTYNYVDLNKTAVYRNGKAGRADVIQTGDTAYIKLDNEGDIASVNAIDNLTVKYGRVLSKSGSELAVKYDDGTEQLLEAGDGVIVVRDKQIAAFRDIKDGDRVRLLLNDNSKSTDLKEITIEGDEHFITNIYKGTVSKLDDISDKIMVMGLQVFNKGTWERTDRKGFTVIPLAEGFRIYSGNTELDTEQANKLLASSDAYIAVEKSYGGDEEAVMLSYRSSSDSTVPNGSDTIANAVTGSGSFTLSRENKSVTYSNGSIVVKYGRLVSGNSLAGNDSAYLALDRDYSTGAYKAAVVKVDEPKTASGLNVYRGRISTINAGKDFTVESFSQQSGTDWNYSNTPKTFQITLGTRMLDSDGIVNVRDFVGYGDNSYLSRVVYVVADGTNAVLVSTAPYGIYNIKGTVYTDGDDKISLRNVQLYSTDSHTWSKIGDSTIGLAKNTVVLKNGTVINPTEIQNGDSVRIIKKDATVSGDAYIVYVE